MILLTWNSFTMMTFTSYGKAMNYRQNKLLTFTIIRNTQWLVQNLYIGTLLLFHLITQIFHLSSKSSSVNFLNSLQSSKLSSNSNFSTQKSFAESVFKSNNTLYFLGTTSTQNYCFSSSAHKSSVATVLIRTISSFSSNSNSLRSRACLAICKAHSNTKSNLILKDHSKAHIFPVSVKPTIPVSVSNFCISSTVLRSTDVVVQNTKF